jgi:hypothetical protein
MPGLTKPMIAPAAINSEPTIVTSWTHQEIPPLDVLADVFF